jgi:hypothetical protein
VPKFVQRPIVIDAVRFVGIDEADGEPTFDFFDEPCPRWLGLAVKRQRRLFVHNGRLFLSTPDGTQPVQQYDYIVRGINGEISLCEPQLFERMHARAA